jgi:hypothetical protein
MQVFRHDLKADSFKECHDIVFILWLIVDAVRRVRDEYRETLPEHILIMIPEEGFRFL